MQDYLSEKINHQDKVRDIFTIKINKLEEFCYNGSDKIAHDMYARFDEFKTEMGYRI